MPEFFDYDDSDFATPLSNNMAIDSDGDMLMKLTDSLTMDMDSGDIHFISGWNSDEN